MSNITLWQTEKQIEEIKKIFAPNLSTTEFQLFVEMGKSTGLNPFLKEIWAVKYNSSAAQIFIGRDGYRKIAQRHPDYDYHYVESVYSNDEFSCKDGVYNHSFNLKNRGELIGAYCQVKRKSSSRPFIVFVNFNEYNTNQSLWKTKPVTMIKKVPESQCLRMAFPDLFSGTYDESEDWVENHNDDTSSKQSKSAQLPNGKKEALKFGESNEDKKLIFETALQIAPAFNLDPHKDSEVIKQVCRLFIGNNPVKENIDFQLNREFYDYMKSKEFETTSEKIVENMEQTP